MMEITRNVILDLLPMYLADEVSADTRALIEKYLETDPELARVTKKTTAVEFPGEIPALRAKESQMEAYKEARRVLFQRTIFWAGLIAFAILSCLGLALLLISMLVSS